MENHLPLTGKSFLLMEDEPLIAMDVENSLRDAGASVIRTVGSVIQAQSAIRDGVGFDAAIVDLHLSDGDASPLVTVLSRRGIPVIVTTGDGPDDTQPDLRNAVAILRKPFREDELIKTMAWLTKTSAGE
jgi:DNA-binding response OmpR family regulator